MEAFKSTEIKLHADLAVFLMNRGSLPQVIHQDLTLAKTLAEKVEFFVEITQIRYHHKVCKKQHVIYFVHI